jgi:hypothetical protein
LNRKTTCLITLVDLGTRVELDLRKNSTLNLTIASSEMTTSATLQIGPYLGSDHTGQPTAWMLKEKNRND